MITDPIADMLTRIRNANQLGYKEVEVPASKLKIEIARILKEEGFITDYSVSGDVKKVMTVTLKYGQNNEKVITGIKRISKPGLRVYVKSNELPRVLGGLGIAIISTSKGVLTDKDARNQEVGGEVVCYVW